MTRKTAAPLATLGVGVVVAAGIFAANAIANSPADPAETDAPVAAAAATLPQATPVETAPADVVAGEAPAADASPSVDAPTTPVTPATTPAVETEAGQVERVHVGKVDNGSITVALAFQDGTVTAYVCDGDEWEIWLTGVTRDGAMLLTGRSEAGAAAAVTGRWTAEASEGELVIGDREWTFDARQAEWPEWAPARTGAEG